MQEIIVNAKNGNFTEQDDGSIVVGEFTLEAGEYTIEYQPLEGVSDVEGGYGLVIAMDTTLTDDLIAEGLARDVIRQIQDMRKEADYQVTDKIQLCLTGEAARAIEAFLPMIEEETLSSHQGDTLSHIDITKNITLEGVGEICIALKR